MTRFNTPSGQRTRTTNLAGGDAYVESPKLELVSILLTSFVQDQFYRGASNTMERAKELIGKIDPLFAAKAAVFARNEYGMRSISHFVAGEIGHSTKGADWTKRFFSKVVRRVDDITEILAYYLSTYGKPLPNSMKKGLADAFGKFDTYQLAKYRAEGKAMSLIDAVNLVHPKPNRKNAKALKALVEGTLRSEDTWESRLTKAGQEAETEEQKVEMKKDAWADLIKSRKIGYFALLKNLRNILEQAPEIVPDAVELLKDESMIRKSLVLPFRFSTAIEEIQKVTWSGVTDILRALNEALEISISNVPKFDGKTLVVVDESGSMRGRPIEMASLFASILVKSNDCHLMLFSNDARYLMVNPMDSLLTIRQIITKDFVGAGTNFVAPFARAAHPYDRIILLSDMQGWMRTLYGGNLPGPAFGQYKKRFNVNPYVYSWDLQGYGSLQLPERNVFCIAGFSEKVFDMMKMLEQDRQALVHTIEQVEI